MIDVIKFCGKNAAESKKKAIIFYRDNFKDTISKDDFFAKCRIQADGKTIYFYPNMKASGKK